MLTGFPAGFEHTEAAEGTEMRVKEMSARKNWPPMNADKHRLKNKCLIGAHRGSSAANFVFFGLLLTLASAGSGQTAAPAFDVASIKPTTAVPGSGSGISSDIGRITGRNVTLKRCIRGAYGIPEAQIFGGPKWVDEESYDIDAKAPGPAGDHEMMAMLQQLLAERFHLVFHRETRPLPGYALVVGKKGLTAKRSEPGIGSETSSSRRSIDATACDMGCLARKLSEVLHAPVADLTGIEGEFDFKLEWTPDDLQTAVLPALEEQLGLKLEGRKVPTEVLIIDSAEKATAN
jgi:uncharacterized protein (TIGR03435 family)